MESALYGIYALVVFVSEILLVRSAHSFDFWYVNNSCVNTVGQHFSMKYSLYILWITLLRQVINSYEAVFHIKSSNLPNSARNRFINLKEAILMFYVKEVNKRNTWEIGQGINKIRNNYISGPFALKKKNNKNKTKQTNK